MSQSPLTRRSVSVPGPLLYSSPQISVTISVNSVCVFRSLCVLSPCATLLKMRCGNYLDLIAQPLPSLFFPLLFYPVLNNATTSVSSLVYRHLLNASKIIFSRDSMCICKEKPVVEHILFNRQLMKSFLPSDWSSERHLHLSVQNLLVDNNL